MMLPDLTVYEKQVLALIERAAANNQPCPSNKTITDHIGTHDFSLGSQIVTKLEVKGYITVDRLGNRREIEIVRTGARTAPSPITSRTTGASLPGKPIAQAMARKVTAEFREPCVACGVRFDRHHEMGCKRWRGR